MLGWLQGLRGLSAFLVLGYHFASMLNSKDSNLGWFLFGAGYIGVDIFFVISGFLMVYVTAQPHEQRSVPFLIKRAFRIMPVLWVVVLATALSRGVPLSGLFSGAILESLFFILPSTEAPQYGQGYIDVLWTLSFEISFYLIFALSMFISSRFRVFVASLIILTMIFGLQHVFAGAYTLNTDLAPPYNGKLYPQSNISILANPYFIQFIPGMIFGELYVRLHKKKNYFLQFCGLVMVFAFFYIYLYRPGLLPLQNKISVAMPWVVMLVAGCLVFEKFSDYKAPRLMIIAGNLTFAIYLCHLPVRDILDSCEYFKPISELPGIQKFFIYTGLSYLIAYGLYRTVEKPAINMGRRLAR